MFGLAFRSKKTIFVCFHQWLMSDSVWWPWQLLVLMGHMQRHLALGKDFRKSRKRQMGPRTQAMEDLRGQRW